MGKKGQQRTEVALTAAQELVGQLEPLGDVTCKGMFGGYGIFQQGVMFALVNSAGEVHLRVDDQTRARFEAEDASKHGRMPYYSVPDRVRQDLDALRTWSAEAAAVATRAKK